VYTVLLALGSLVGGVSGGYIIAAGGIHWIHWTNVIMSAAILVAGFFFLAETSFDRAAALGYTESPTATVNGAAEKMGTTTVERTAPRSDFAPFTFPRSLKIGVYRGRFFHQVVLLLQPLRLPGVWLVSLWYAGLVGGIVTISTIGPTLVASPPYLWGKNAGLINVGGIVGSTCGAIYTYFIADYATKSQAKSNSEGYSEPEARLWTALPGLFLASTGLWAFGFSAANPGSNHWIGLQFGAGMLAFGLMQAPSIGFNYVSPSKLLIEKNTELALDHRSL
jgi:hypothetical protein